MRKTSKIVCLLISICMFFSILSSLAVAAEVQTADSSITRDGTVSEVTAVPPILPSPDPIPPIEWNPPTIPPYEKVIPLVLDAENVLQLGDIGSVTFQDLYGGASWHYNIENPDIIRLDSSITVPNSSPNADPAIAMPVQSFDCNWYFKALKQGTTYITFYQDYIYTLKDTMPALRAITFKIRVGDPLPPTPTQTLPPKPTPPLPTPQNYVPLDPAAITTLSIGSIGVVKQDFNSYYAWTFEIGDRSVIDNLQYVICEDGKVTPDGSIAPYIYPYPGPWYFTALKEGETTITFTGNPTNPLMKMPSMLVEYKVKVTSSGEVTINPTIPPKPTPPPPPTPENYVALNAADTNVLNVGSIGIVKMEYNSILVWSYQIEDPSIIDNRQIMPMLNGDAAVTGEAMPAIYPYPGPWYFTALKEGETTITFTATTLNGEKILTPSIVYKVKVTAAGEVTVKPTPVNTDSGETKPVITPIPKPSPCDPVFVDPAGYEWAVEAVTNLQKSGVINGYEDGTFKPGNDVTRAEFAKMLVLTFGIYDENAVSTFGDVPAGEWFNSYVASAEQEGLAKGVGDGCFAPDSTVTREEMFTFCARAIEKYKGYNVLDKASPEIAEQVNSFVDGGEVNGWATEYVATVTKCGLVTGAPSETGGGKEINPQDPIKRAEVAVVLNKAMQL